MKKIKNQGPKSGITRVFKPLRLNIFSVFSFKDTVWQMPRDPLYPCYEPPIYSNRQGRRFHPFCILFSCLRPVLLWFTRRTPSVVLFGPLESCERVIIEDVASIGAISHLCRLSNRYAITSQWWLSWLKCLLVKENVSLSPHCLSLAVYPSQNIVCTCRRVAS